MIRKLQIFLLLIFISWGCIFAQVNTTIQNPDEKAIIPETAIKKQINTIELKQEAFLKAEINNSILKENTNSDNTQQLNLQKTDDEDDPEIKKRRTEIKKSPPVLTKGTKAAPANDSICNAITIPLDGSCLTGQGTAGATGDYYGGCIEPSSQTVFYTFTVTAPNEYVTVEIKNPVPSGSEVQIFLMDGTCTSPSGISTQCQLTPIVFDLYNMTPGTYFLMVATQPGVGNELTSFEICTTQGPMPTLIEGPEQDCFGAIPVCSQTYTQDISYVNYWDTDEIPNGQTCLYGGENNSVWYVFTAQVNGNLAFMINTVYDYDWALYNLTAIGGCAAIPTSVPVLCNYSDNPGPTGTTGVNATIPRSEPWNGSEIMDGIPVTAGTTYVLIIDNWTGGATGYTLDFGAGSPVIDNPGGAPPTGEYPHMHSATASCTANTILITMNELVNCLTVSPNDFILTNTTTSTDFTSAITQVSGYNCSSSNGALTTQIQITHNGTLTSGVYEIEINTNPVLEDKCGNKIIAGGTVTFNYLSNITLTATPSTICIGATTVDLDANGVDGLGLTYTLNPGGLTNNTDGIFPDLSPTLTTTYIVSVTGYGCTKTGSALVTVQDNIVAAIDPINPVICSGTTTLTASTTINGSPCGTCTYLWSTSATTAAINVGPGTYTVTATTSAGCTSTNNPSSTVSFASAGGGGICDVIYVSPAGGGDGLTKATPTDLKTALAAALCSNTIIKMQIGTYTFDEYLQVNSYVTIEGGFNVGFTSKTSNLTDGNCTKIVRSPTTADIGSGGLIYTMFKVVPGAVNFRFQDLRIILPNTHSSGTLKTNYGIYLGAGCSGYNIVRCYIDAGEGASQ